MSDRVCVRGCLARDVHYATCPRSDQNYTGPVKCKGCAPRECRDGSLICDRCFGRLRGLVRDADDLMGRLRALADPMKATPTDKAPGGRSASVEPPAPVDADLADAMNDIGHTLRDWDRHTGYELEKALPDLVNNAEHVRVLGIGFLDRHPLVDGIREFWSVQDAVDKWGVERRTDTFVYPDDEDDAEVVVTSVPEWKDRLLVKVEAEREAGSARTLRRWVKNGLIEPAGRLRYGDVVTPWYRYSDIVRIRQENRENVVAGQFGAEEN